MNAGSTESSNILTFDYQDLTLEIMKDDQNQEEKKGLLSLIANSAIRHNNMPDNNNYRVAEYQALRNIYRGPFNFWWETIKEGMLHIFPTGISRILMGNQEKQPQKDEKKQGS